MNICTCNLCGNIFEDTNPQTNAINYPDFGLDTLTTQPDGDGFFIGCPVCNDDGDLTDNINWPALNDEAKAILNKNNITK